MQWTVLCLAPPLRRLFAHIVSGGNQCREERGINDKALQGFAFKRFTVGAFHECHISCERELICQSNNYVVGENSCELNNRTKETTPEHFRSDRHVLI